MRYPSNDRRPIMVGMPFLRVVIGFKLYHLPPEERGFHISDIDERDCIRAWDYMVNLDRERA